jgi:hypothetical protein
MTNVPGPARLLAGENRKRLSGAAIGNVGMSILSYAGRVQFD